LATDLARVTYSVNPADIRRLQSSILDVSGATVLEGNGFIEALEAHFFKQFGVKLSAMALARVGTYTCFVGSEGRLKLLPLESDLSDESLRVLQYLTFIASH
jgi:hypothetical protein